MTILVTGGCGFIGSNFINRYYLNYPNSQIINVDCLNYCAKETNVSNPNCILYKTNICETEKILEILNTHQIDTVIHFAAQSHVDNSFEDSLPYTKDNVLGTHSMLEAVRQYGKIKLFLHFSTDEVYGEVDIHHKGCCEEQSLLNPTNPYAATKAAAEFLVRSYGHSFKLPFIIIRCNNVYGPNQYPEKLIPKFIKLLREGKKCTIHGSGETRRNFIHVFDVSSAIETILQKGLMGTIINIGTSNEFSVLEIASKLIKLIKGDSTNVTDYLEYVPDRPFNDFRYHINNEKLTSMGWKEMISFDEGLIELNTF